VVRWLQSKLKGPSCQFMERFVHFRWHADLSPRQPWWRELGCRKPFQCRDFCPARREIGGWHEWTVGTDWTVGEKRNRQASSAIELPAKEGRHSSNLRWNSAEKVSESTRPSKGLFCCPLPDQPCAIDCMSFKKIIPEGQAVHSMGRGRLINRSVPESLR
jgi:hypothetical protein